MCHKKENKENKNENKETKEENKENQDTGFKNRIIEYDDEYLDNSNARA
jgi:hypothetical protein